MKNNTKKKHIQLLPPELTNQIAAGEVVERPASVVKELLENALDAHANEISVIIENGGQSLISVQDNGIGIAKEELELAVTRHATSKLQDIAGLSQINSYGFRGEALPSIASVSSFSIISRYTETQNNESLDTEYSYKKSENNTANKPTSLSEEAAQLRVEFGKVQELAPCAWQKGTLIEVRDLFFNIPARLKFLKTPATELKKSTELFVRLALVAKNVHLSLYAGSRLVHEFKKKESLKERLSHIWPPAVVEALLPIDYKAYGIQVTGFISHPRSHQPRADRMLYYVNGRAVNDKILMRATKQAFQGKLTTRDYPQCILCIELAPEEVDVNVHPAKNEVRFRDEQSIFVAIMRAISLALEKDTSHFSAKQLVQNKEDTQKERSERSQDTGQEAHQEICQEARIGDLFIPKPKGFWGDMDKEQGLSFVKEEAERKRQEAIEKSYYHEDWQVVEVTNTNEASLSKASTIDTDTGFIPDSVPVFMPDTPYSGSKTQFEEAHTPIEPLPDTFDIFKTSPEKQNVFLSHKAGQKASLSREEEQLLHAKKASLCLPEGLVYVGQIAKTYLVLQKFDTTSHANALILLDQHAIHERILYEEAKKGLVNSQNLLVPLEFPVHKSERSRLEDILPLLKKLAFNVQVTEFACQVHAIPATLTRLEATEFLKDALAQKTDNLEKIWISHSCKSALKANTELDTQSALKLILRWLETEEPDYCPHGRPCVLHFDAQNLEQMFKR